MMRYSTVASALAMAMMVTACGGGDTSEPAGQDSMSTEPAASEAPAAEPTDVAETPAPTETATPEVTETPAPTPVPTATTAAAAAKPATAVAAVSAPATAPASFNVCKACHAVEAGKNGIGPTLAGVFGAKAGYIAGFDYSDAMLESGLTWNEANLDKYLADPRKVIPGTKMSFGGMKDDAKRKELVDYLKSL